jgi:hypothetical protein
LFFLLFLLTINHHQQQQPQLVGRAGHDHELLGGQPAPTETIYLMNDDFHQINPCPVRRAGVGSPRDDR